MRFSQKTKSKIRTKNCRVKEKEESVRTDKKTPEHNKKKIILQNKYPQRTRISYNILSIKIFFLDH